MINRIVDSINFRTQFRRTNKKYDLIIVDDYLPAHASPWRIHEFEYLVNKIPNSLIYTTQKTYLETKNKGFDSDYSDLANYSISVADKLIRLKRFSNIRASIVYTLFYQNILWLFPYLKLNKQKFAFTLYPGGGFTLSKGCLKNLEEIINSKLCMFVIVNQEFTKKYLIENANIPAEKIHVIFGVPLPDIDLNTTDTLPRGKKLKCVFIAHKYMNFGLDKGFDTFINVAHLLEDTPSIEFHVIGNFTSEDILLDTTPKNLRFHGILIGNEMNQLISKMDIILSPNRKNMLSRGAFDGFPLASSVQAGLQGCCMLLSNPNNESEITFVSGSNYIKVGSDFDEIVDIIKMLENDREKLIRIAQSGSKTLKSLYSDDIQMNKRLQLFTKYCNV